MSAVCLQKDHIRRAPSLRWLCRRSGFRPPVPGGPTLRLRWSPPTPAGSPRRQAAPSHRARRLFPAVCRSRLWTPQGGRRQPRLHQTLQRTRGVPRVREETPHRYHRGLGEVKPDFRAPEVLLAGAAGSFAVAGLGLSPVGSRSSVVEHEQVRPVQTIPSGSDLYWCMHPGQKATTRRRGNLVRATLILPGLRPVAR